MAASAASRELLAEGVRAVLHTWPVLQIAVDQGFGGVYGQQKADWMVDVVQQYFHDNADLQQYEVEDFLSDLLDQEFNTVVDDGSLPQVCGSLMLAFSQWSRGEHQELRNHIQVLNQRRGRVSVRAPPPEDEDTPPGDQDTPPGEDSDHEDTQVMEVDSSRTEAPPPPPEAPPPPPEDDGWTVVRKRK